MACAGDASFKYCRYQLSMGSRMPSMVFKRVTGGGEFGDWGEGRVVPEREPEKLLPPSKEAQAAGITQSRSTGR